jgi:hypothetical protein
MDDFTAQIIELNKAIEEMDKLSQTFFNKIIDFLKWTTTISIGSLALIGNVVFNHINSGIAYFLILVSILCLFESIFWALFTFKRLIDFGFEEWKTSFTLHKFQMETLEMKIKEKRTPVEEIIIAISELTKIFRSAIISFLHSSKLEPDFFERNITYHIGLLIAGLMFFVISIFYLAAPI